MEVRLTSVLAKRRPEEMCRLGPPPSPPAVDLFADLFLNGRRREMDLLLAWPLLERPNYWCSNDRT